MVRGCLKEERENSRVVWPPSAPLLASFVCGLAALPLRKGGKGCGSERYSAKSLGQSTPLLNAQLVCALVASATPKGGALGCCTAVDYEDLAGDEGGFFGCEE
jgi:hypothetical protein